MNTPVFSRSANSFDLPSVLPLLSNVTGSGKSKMAAEKTGSCYIYACNKDIGNTSTAWDMFEGTAIPMVAVTMPPDNARHAKIQYGGRKPEVVIFQLLINIFQRLGICFCTWPFQWTVRHSV